MRYLLILSFLIFAACSDDGPDKNPVGETCEIADDCEGDSCLLELRGFFSALTFPEGYCSTLECSLDNLAQDCAGGEGICLVYNPSGSFDCYQRCVSDEECPREEYGCLVFDNGEGACVPTYVIPEGHGVVGPALSNQ